MDSNLLDQIVVLSSSWSFIHNEKIEYLHVINSLHFENLAKWVATTSRERVRKFLKNLHAGSLNGTQFAHKVVHIII